MGKKAPAKPIKAAPKKASVVQMPVKEVVTNLVSPDVRLAFIVESSNASGVGYTFMSIEDLSGIEPMYIQTNPNLNNAKGEVAVAATALGKAHISQLNQEKEEPMTSAFPAPVAVQTVSPTSSLTGPVVSKYAIDSHVALPTDSGRASRAGYPFKSMEVGHSFFVPNSEETPDARKKLSPSVGNANKLLTPKHFIVRTDGIGARVWRDK